MAQSPLRSPSVPSEGEIVEPNPKTKATASNLPLNGTTVDRPTRASPSLAPKSPISYDGHRSRSRSRSPYRANRKRRHGYDENRNPPYEQSQRYGARDEDRHDQASSRRPKSYHDLDHGLNYDEGLRYSDDYDRGKDKRQRTRSRSRSPFREQRKPRKYSSDEHGSNSGRPLERPAERVVSERAKASAAPDSKLGAEDNQVPASSNRQAYVSNEEPTEIAESEPVNEDDALEARRKRREAIRAKYRSQATPLHLKALNVESETDASTPGTEPTSAKETSDSIQASPFQPGEESLNLSVPQDSDLANPDAHVDDSWPNEQSAADFDPVLDMQEEQQRHANVQIGKNDISSAAFDELETAAIDASPSGPAPAPADELDMFADDDDMFAEESNQARSSQATARPAKETDVNMMDDWDDAQGYYRIQLGELVKGRYQIQQSIGKGTFSAVVRALDNQTGKLVAIKFIRQGHSFHREGAKEVEVLNFLQQADPEGKHHIIKFDRHFNHRGHLCLVFENLNMNLRELLTKFGKNVGLNLRAVRAYGQQMFLAISLLRHCKMIHADLKPDNMLVNEQRNLLKICDLGSAFPAADAPSAPELASRFYRAPETMLGIPIDFAIDTWAIGCTLFEIYTGNILFTGPDNNQMLRSIMECRGNIPPRVLRRGSLTSDHFALDHSIYTFVSQETDLTTGEKTDKRRDFKKPPRDLKTRLMGQGTRGMSDIEAKELMSFIDLLDRCLAVNPEKRITPDEAMKHPFLARRF